MFFRIRGEIAIFNFLRKIRQIEVLSLKVNKVSQTFSGFFIGNSRLNGNFEFSTKKIRQIEVNSVFIS